MRTKWGPGRSEVQGAFIKRRYVSMLVEMTQKTGRNDNAIQKLQKKKKLSKRHIRMGSEPSEGAALG